MVIIILSFLFFFFCYKRKKGGKHDDESVLKNNKEVQDFLFNGDIPLQSDIEYVNSFLHKDPYADDNNNDGINDVNFDDCSGGGSVDDLYKNLLKMGTTTAGYENAHEFN